MYTNNENNSDCSWNFGNSIIVCVIEILRW